MDNLIKFAIKQPIAVAAMVFLIIAFGFVSLQKIPIQMTPDIDKPVLQVRVSWPGASPKDVEREVVTRVELAVSSLTGVETVESDSRFGSARVTLTYSVGQDMDIALVQLLSKVSSIDGLPFDAKRPTVRTSNSDDSPISRLAMIKLPGSKVQDLGSLGDFVEYEIIEKLSRIEGVSEITFRGGQRKELKVVMFGMLKFLIVTFNLLNFIKQIEKELGKKAIRNYMTLQKGDVKKTLSDTNNLEALIS